MASIFNKDFFLNIHLLFNRNLICPTYKIDSISEFVALVDKINPKAIIFDLDQTLVPYGKRQLNESTVTAVNLLKKSHNCCILSNVPNYYNAIQRIKEISATLSIPFICTDYKKPSPQAFILALETIKTTSKETVIIGDRLFTDIVGGNNLGITTVYIKPLEPKLDPIIVRISRLLENYILWFYRNKSNT